MIRRATTLVLLILLAGCGGEPGTLFVERTADETGVDFRNDLRETPTFNILTYLYFYDGGGVAAGDVDGDGRVDLYFTSNQGPNRLYLNRGNFRFEDVTEAAGVAGTAGWTKGATMADVNGDGHLDLYVTAVNHLDAAGRNQLFINDGDGTFTDRAAEYGLDFEGYSTQAAFFDYDRDGDLDVYLLNHSVHQDENYGPASLRQDRHPTFGDRLYRNDGPPEAPRFTDVTEAAGIYGGAVGYGLGLVVSDLDLDGWPDVYVANDFHENDYLYFNNGDGTFSESVQTAMGHTSRSSMGIDAADVDNDGRPDLAVLDMLPADEAVVKTADSAEPLTLYNLKRRLGYHHQLIRNTLQLNRGARRFSDVAFFAGVAATDWSWSPLLADFDNDGWADLFVTNGIPRRPNDLDHVTYTGAPAVQAALREDPEAARPGLIARMPETRIPNAAFRNEGDLTFTDRTAAWGLEGPGVSNGAAYADLDGDGDLDLVVNHLGAPASIYENRAEALEPARHWLAIRLEGEGGNTAGIGAKVIVRSGGTTRLREQMPTRGWASSVDPRLHVGLGASPRVDTLVVVWPDARYQLLADVPADTVLTLRQADAGGQWTPPRADAPLFEDVTEALALPYRHAENAFIDFNREHLMPHKVSAEGPALAVGDVDGDGLDDVFAGGAKREAARLLLQQTDGRFVPAQDALWRADSLHEDVDAAFLDADADGDLDLYVVSAGNEFWGTQDALRDRLYRNDGTGRLARDEAALPDHFANGCCVAPADYDGDGDLDLFVGSRVTAWEYGVAPRSVLLENDGTGRFRDVTDTAAPALAGAGLLTAATWSDVDGDAAPDLVVVGEWMAPRVFANRDGRLEPLDAGLDDALGWWSAVTAADLDGDGDADLVLGNLGLNSRLKASPSEPVRLYVSDFDGNGRSDAILTRYHRGVSYPLASRDQLVQQLPTLARRYTSYAAYGASRIDDVLRPGQLDSALVREATTFASAVALNDGAGRFTLRPLPTLAQLAPVRAAHAGDFDGDGFVDLLVAGNTFGVGPERGRYDASYGLVLRGDGTGAFTPMDLEASGVLIDGEVRALRRLRLADGTPVLLAARNDAPLQAFSLRPPPSASAPLPAPAE